VFANDPLSEAGLGFLCGAVDDLHRTRVDGVGVIDCLGRMADADAKRRYWVVPSGVLDVEAKRVALGFVGVADDEAARARPLRRGGGVAGKDPIELGAGADAELEEHLPQVVLDRSRADE
jgi:hypothetical protein